MQKKTTANEIKSKGNKPNVSAVRSLSDEGMYTLLVKFALEAGRPVLLDYAITDRQGAGAAQTAAQSINDSIFVKENKTLQRVYLNDILYIQAMGDYVSIYLRDRKITIHQNLKALEEKLPPQLFIRVHRSFMVSLSKIDAIEEGTVYINSTPLPIGEVYKEKLMKLLNIIR